MERQHAASENDRGAKAGSASPSLRVSGDTHSLHIQRMVGNQGLAPAHGAEGAGGNNVESRLEARRGGGMPLPSATRSLMESRIGADFGNVRVHADGEAASMSSALGARAFTLGRDIYFGDGEYHPESHDGGRLLAHELTHTIQQGESPVAGRADGNRGGSAAGIIQRQEAPKAPEITAKTIFPFPTGKAVELERIMMDMFFTRMGEKNPKDATGFNALDRQKATITTSTDDEVSGTVPNPVAVPAVVPPIDPEVPEADRPKPEAARTLTEVTLRLRRRKEKDATLFDLELLWKEPDAKEAEVHFARRDMTATLDNESDEQSVILSQKGAPILRSIVRDEGKSVLMKAFTAPYAKDIPDALKFLVPKEVDLLSGTLSDAPPAPPGTKEKVEQMAVALPKHRTPSIFRTQMMGGVGFQHGARFDPVLTNSWQISFMPAPNLGSLVQIPIEIQVQYAPPQSVIGSLSSGLELSFSQLQIPINIRVIDLGIGGGAMQGNEPDGGGPRPHIPALGPMLGLGGGLEIGAFRLDLRYDHIFNLWESAPDTLGPDLNTLSLRAGGVW